MFYITEDRQSSFLYKISGSQNGEHYRLMEPCWRVKFHIKNTLEIHIIYLGNKKI